MRIGIYGGTFDPFHMGHMALIVKAFEQNLVDKVVIVPTTVNYYRPDKRYLFSYDEKVTIIKDFLVKCPYDVEIDTIEKDKDGTWRSINLVQYFHDKYPEDELFLMIGEDSFKEFTTWTRYKDILKLAKLIVANRSDHVSKTLKMNDNLKRGFDFYCKDSSPDTIDAPIPIIEAIPLDMSTEFEECSATNVRNTLIAELMDMYLSDKEYYGRT